MAGDPTSGEKDPPTVGDVVTTVGDGEPALWEDMHIDKSSDTRSDSESMPGLVKSQGSSEPTQCAVK